MQVLLEILSFWNGDLTGVMYPSTDTLVDCTGYSARTLCRAFKALRESGLLLHVGGGNGHGQPNVWKASPALSRILEQ